MRRIDDGTIQASFQKWLFVDWLVVDGTGRLGAFLSNLFLVQINQPNFQPWIL
jgi:hypothetical protein